MPSTTTGPPTPTPTPDLDPPTPTPTPPTDEDEELGSLDSSIAALSDSSADQLLSTAVPDGLSNPFSSAQDGWSVGPQEVDPYTNVAGQSEPLTPYAALDVDPYTGMPADGANPNTYTGGQTVDPFSGFQDESFGGGGGAADTSQMLASEGLITPDDTGQSGQAPASASQVVTLNAQISATDSGNGPIYVPNDLIIGQNPIGRIWRNDEWELHYRITDADGVTYDVYSNDTGKRIPSNMVEVVPVSSTTLPSPAPGADWTSLLNPQMSQRGPAAAPITSSPTPTPQLGSGSAPYNPMADSPFARSFLYGNIPYLTPAFDFLTNDTHLRYLQNTALVVGLAGTAIATGGLLTGGSAFGFGAAGATEGLGAAEATEGLGATERSTREFLSRFLADTGGAGKMGVKMGGVTGVIAAGLNKFQGAQWTGSEYYDILRDYGYRLHHVFAQELEDWFLEIGVEDIHEYTYPLEEAIHTWLHSPSGGNWNAVWEQWFIKNAFPNGLTAQDAANFAVYLFKLYNIPFDPRGLMPYQ
jgi:hypothetical protein